MLWTAYLAGGDPPRGAEFVRVVAELADRAGIDSAPIERETPRDRRADLLEEFFTLAQRELVSDRGNAARAYLEQRGLPRDAIEGSGLGVVPPSEPAQRALAQAGFRDAEIRAAGVLADSRWPGRLCGAWRTEWGRIGTLWTRGIDDAEAAETRYLYLRGASRTDLPPYGLGRGLRELVLVEGFFDYHQLRARGVENVAALGGTSTNSRLFERLSRLGVQEATLCFDADAAGRAATSRAVENAVRACASPGIYVVDSIAVEAEDPDALVSKRGLEAWGKLVRQRVCGITWHATEIVREITPESPVPARREALKGAGAWLGTLPARLALEQEDAVRIVAERCGYSPEASTRLFRARFWTDLEPSRELARSPVVDAAPEL